MGPLDLLMLTPASLLLLLANIGLSIVAFNDEALIGRLMFDVGRMRRYGEWYRMLTSGFVHVGPLHLAVNMLGLFSLGPALELGLVTGPFLLLYVGSLLAGSGWSLMEHFRDPGYRAVGASGAISGLATAFAIFAPLEMFLVFFVVPMPAFLFAIVYIALSAWAASAGRQDGVGHAAHLGGALAGVAIVCIGWPDAPRQMIETIMAALV